MNKRLKELQVRGKKIDGEIKIAEEMGKRHKRELKSLEKEEEQLTKTMEHLIKSSSVPIVSEHAILRYMERIMGIDMEKIRENIILAGEVRDGEIPLLEDHKAVVRNNVVISIKSVEE